jgi:hypothetical protein
MLDHGDMENKDAKWVWTKRAVLAAAFAALFVPIAIVEHMLQESVAPFPGEQAAHTSVAVLEGGGSMIPKWMREGYLDVADQKRNGKEAGIRHHPMDPWRDRNEQQHSHRGRNDWRHAALQEKRYGLNGEADNRRRSMRSAAHVSHPGGKAPGCRDGWGEHPIECLRSSIQRAKKNDGRKRHVRVKVKQAHDGISRERERIDREVCVQMHINLCV